MGLKANYGRGLVRDLQVFQELAKNEAKKHRNVSGGNICPLHIRQGRVWAARPDFPSALLCAPGFSGARTPSSERQDREDFITVGPWRFTVAV
jgi:hypothetical protein